MNDKLAVNPLNLLPKLFEDNLPVERVKAVIRRLFPVIKLVRKSGKFTTVFYIEVTPGALFAEISDTPIIEGKQISMTLQVIGGAERPCNWVVSQVN